MTTLGMVFPLTIFDIVTFLGIVSVDVGFVWSKHPPAYTANH